jgi:OmpA-OmpF porin, OOP family
MFKMYHAAIGFSALLALVPARAQLNPSADDLIRSLQPTPQSKPGETRGIHRLTPSHEAAAETPDAVAGQHKPHTATSGTQVTSANGTAPSASIYVQFQTGSDELTPQAAASLNELGKALGSSALSSYRFRIEGHTDTVGQKDYNQALSERRATAVVRYIEQKFSIDASRLTSVGMGSDHLLVPTPAQTPEARNRRVQVVNIGT